MKLVPVLPCVFPMRSTCEHYRDSIHRKGHGLGDIRQRIGQRQLRPDMKARCSTGGRLTEHLGKGISRLARLRVTQLKRDHSSEEGREGRRWPLPSASRLTINS